MDLSAGQRSKTYYKEDSQMVSEEENKGVGMSQSITRLKSNITFVEEAEDQDSPTGPSIFWI